MTLGITFMSAEVLLGGECCQCLANPFPSLGVFHLLVLTVLFLDSRHFFFSFFFLDFVDVIILEWAVWEDFGD